jgi:nucleoside-diphosphate-sugar epimerase
LAKIAGIVMCKSYNRQHGTNFIAAMPTNLYGPGDNFDLETSHVMPALMRKFHDAKTNGAAEVEVWGTGSPRREFLYVDDLADALVYLKGLKPKNLIGAAFGSYGWSGESVKDLNRMLEEMGVELVSDGISALFIPDDEVLARCYDLGKDIAERLAKEAQ